MIGGWQDQNLSSGRQLFFTGIQLVDEVKSDHPGVSFGRPVFADRTCFCGAPGVWFLEDIDEAQGDCRLVSQEWMLEVQIEIADGLYDRDAIKITVGVIQAAIDACAFGGRISGI